MTLTPRLLLTLIIGFGVGWFLLSWRLIGTAPGDAAEEALGASLGLLLFVTIVGAFLKGRAKSPKR